jgi:hypothetical protein
MSEDPKRDVNRENVQTWVELMQSFDGARGHFAESARHAILGVSETVRVFQTLAAEQENGFEYGTEVVSLLDLIRRGLAMWADKIPSLLEASNLDVAKREALVTVKEVILAEMSRVREKGGASNEDEIKLDALDAILRVVDMELERRAGAATQEYAGPGPLRRVVIE